MEGSQVFLTESKRELNKLNSKPGEGEGPELPWGASAGWHHHPLWAAHPLMWYCSKACAVWFELETTGGEKMLVGREPEAR